MRNPLRPETIERISAAQKGVIVTPEARLNELKHLISKEGVGSPYARERWRAEIEQLELDLETQKAIEIVAANANQFRYMRQAIAFACIRAEEQQLEWLDEPTDAELQLIADEQEANGISEWLEDSEGNFLQCPRCGDPYTTDNRNICLNCGLPIRYDEPPTSGEQTDAAYGRADLWTIGNTLHSYPREWSNTEPDQIGGEQNTGE